MNIPPIVGLITLIIGIQVVVWGLIFYRMARQADAIRSETWKSGEMIVLGPVRASYQGWNGRFGVSKSVGTLALLDRRVLFKRPLGPDISLDLQEIAEVSGTVTLGSHQHTFASYVSLVMRDGTNVVFILRDAPKWIEEIRQRLTSA